MAWSLGQSVVTQIKEGKLGLNKGYATAFDEIKIRQKENITVLGGTGSGKSFLVKLSLGWCALRDYYDNYREDSDRVFHWHLYSMEMDRDEVALRIASFVYASSCKTQLPGSVIAGMVGELKPEDETWLLENAVPLMDKYDKYLTIQGKSSVKQMNSDLHKFYKPYGEFYEENNRQYFKTKLNILCLCTVDHVALLKGEGSKKQNIDILASWEVDMKLKFKTTFVNVQQLNRSEGSLDKLKFAKNPQPTLAEAKDSGDLIDSSTLVLAVFNPHRFGIDSYFDYLIVDTHNQTGLGDRGRFLFFLKSRHGEAGKILATAFYGESGIFTKLPKPQVLSRYVRDILKGKYFWKNDSSRS